MPQLITFAGRPVKRRRRVTGGLLLTLYAAERDAPGDQLVVTEDDWRRRGRIDFYARGTLPDVRALVANTHSKSST